MSRPLIPPSPTGDKRRTPTRLQEQTVEEEGEGSDEGSVAEERVALSPRVPMRPFPRSSSPASGAGSVALGKKTVPPTPHIKPQVKITERPATASPASQQQASSPSQALRAALGARRMSSRSSVASSQLLERIRSTSAAGQRVSIDLTKIGTMDLQEGLPPTLEELGLEPQGVKNPMMLNRVSSSLPLDPDALMKHMADMKSKRTLNEELGEHLLLTSLPPPRAPEHVRFRRPDFVRQFLRFPRSIILLKIRGLMWFFSLLWPQMMLGFLVAFVANAIFTTALLEFARSGRLSDLQRVHGLIGTILSFTMSFRTNAAYDRYYEGRKLVGAVRNHIREVVIEAYGTLPAVYKKARTRKDSTDTFEDPEEAVSVLSRVPTELRRRMQMVFAFIRQDLRESRAGFLPGCELEVQGVPFDNEETFYMDPVRPRLWDLMSKDDLARYAHVPVECRAAVAIGDAKAMLATYAQQVDLPAVFTSKLTGHFTGLLDTQEAMQRIRDVPVPYPYVAVLNLTTFVFVYATPFLYVNTGMLGTFIGVQLLAISYYGVLMIGLQLENPFGYDSHDLPLEAYSTALHSDTLAIAQALANDNVSFIPDYLAMGNAKPIY